MHKYRETLTILSCKKCKVYCDHYDVMTWHNNYANVHVCMTAVLSSVHHVCTTESMTDGVN